MRALVQRVSKASVSVDGQIVGAIGAGLLVLLGVRAGDTEKQARWLAHKVANLRIFPDAGGKMNLSALATGGQILIVSQFTLYGETKRGFRPSFAHAAAPEVAEPLVEHFVQAVRDEGVLVETGVFRAYMQVDLINDGPVTIILEKNPPEA